MFILNMMVGYFSWTEKAGGQEKLALAGNIMIKKT
tara:strand:+ start:516 stop:620 length:105 start_codon:yes stop_codon:yes gene_type:complete